MNSKLVNIFFVCLITLIVLFPSLTVLGLVWEKHIEFVKTKQNISIYHTSIKSEPSAFGFENNYLTKNDFLNLDIYPKQANIKLSHKYQICHLWRWLFLFIPFCFGLVIFLYDRYLVYRAHIFQQQVDMLEKLWQQTLEK